ncbi:hypothetical protein [Ulvibacterium sp.]|uniref:hypothetical protein n=1 Tax=Ulvibacterium sp. TaxID=2665914 RepID=UPI002634A641|nr:hypothetical protein [Ulvibacterium sp.]
MGSKMRLIWDFRGLKALPRAENYKGTLNEFLVREKYSYKHIEVKQYSMFYTVVQLVVDIEDVEHFRKILKPERGEGIE